MRASRASLFLAVPLCLGCGRLGYEPHPPDGSDPTGGSVHRGEVLFVEDFEDGDYGSRGWFDVDATGGGGGPGDGSLRSFECVYQAGSRSCDGGDPGRREFAATESLYMTWRVRYSPGYLDGGTELRVFTTADRALIGGAESPLGLVVEARANAVAISIRSSRFINSDCVQLTGGEVRGCDGGELSAYDFGGMRAVCGCNGVHGHVDEWGCSGSDDSYWTECSWEAAADGLFDGEWHRVEVYLRMNSVIGGVGVPDGSIRYWIDGQPVLSSDEILLRTGAPPNLAFDQIMLRPLRDSEGPVQTHWTDDFVVARGRMP